MKNKIKSILPSIILYGLGLSSLFFLDFYISTSYEDEFVSKWAFLKSSIFILGSFCVLGLDQVLVRSPKVHLFIKKHFLLQSLVISIIGVLIIDFFVFIDNFIVFLVAVNLFSVVTFFSGVFRANQKFIFAQLATNGWKIILLVLFFVLTNDMNKLLIISLLITILILIFLYIKVFNNEDKIKDKKDYKNYRKIGFAFFLHNMTLIAAIHGEQFIINLFQNQKVSSELFMYFSVFSPIILSANGFIGFIIGPKLRAKNNVEKRSYRKLQLILFLAAIFLAITSTIIGLYLLNFIKEIPLSEVNIYLILLVVLCCIIRTVYTASSLYLGVFGNMKYLYITALFNWCVLFLYIILIILVFLGNFSNSNILILIAFLTTLHWFLRLLISNFYALKVFKNGK